jgi:hypothetical protein
MRIATSADMFGFTRRVRSTDSTNSPDRAAIPASAVLSNWADAQWTDGCQVDELPEFQPLTVMTMNHLYEIVVLGGHDGLVRIRGGLFFPEWRDVLLAGCSLGGSFLKLRGIYAGFRMEIHVEGEVIITSPVQKLALAQLDLNGRH